METTTLPLPFDDETDCAVPFVLTAAAHREVLGRTPSLTAVTAADAPQHDPSRRAPADDGADDTRRLQARALRRSGMPDATIAAALGVDVDVVTTWTEGLDDELARRRRRRQPSGGRPGGRRAVSGAPVAPASAPVEAPAGVEEDPAAGRVDPATLLPGLAVALAEPDADGVTIAHDRLDPVAVLVDALRAEGVLAPGRVRVAVRVGTDEPLDRTRAVVAARLGVEPATVTAGRAADGSRTGLRLRVDVRDVAAAEVVLRWIGRSGLRGWDSNPQTFRLTADCSAS